MRLVPELTAIKEDASRQAGEALALLTSEITDSLYLSRNDGRNRLNKAVQTARHYLSEGTKGVPLFQSWGALKDAADNLWPETITEALAKAEGALDQALAWHEKQSRDEKLRLKALASKFFVAEDELSQVAECPLCESDLSTEEQKALAKELAELKENADAAERAIGDACTDIEKALNRHVPDKLRRHINELAEMNPAQGFADSVRARFSETPPFSDVLTGIAEFVNGYIATKADVLPAFTHTEKTYPASELADVARVRDLMIRLHKVAALVDWWPDNRDAFVNAWQRLLGVPNENSEWPEESLERKLEKLEQAIAGSEPLDKIATHLEKAVEAAQAWKAINEVQVVREAVAEAVSPLKDLQVFVDCETHRTRRDLIRPR